MNTFNIKIGIIGGGPAGYALALKLALSGIKVFLFEKDKLGGTCLNKGCIPTKSILHNTNLIYKTKNLQKFGIITDFKDFDFSKIIENKNSTVEKLNKSLGMLLKSYDIEVVTEEVISVEKNRIITKNACYETEKIVLATGTKPLILKGFEPDNRFIFDSDGILELKKVPKSIVIIGSGAIGIEWSRIFSDLGTEVTLIEAAERILPIADAEVSSRVERLLKKKRVKTEKGTFAQMIKGNQIILSNGKTIDTEAVLVAVGRKPIMPDTKLNIEQTKGYLKVDNNYMTNIKNIFAIGDINGKSMLAHSATHQAIELAEYLTKGMPAKFDQIDIPSVIYGEPEIAWFGKTEEMLTNTDYKKTLFPVSAIGKAHTDEQIDGFIKILTDNDNKILGASIIAPEASAMIMQLLIAKENNLSYQSILKAVFPHPTFSEGVFEALLSLDGQSLSLPKPKE